MKLPSITLLLICLLCVIVYVQCGQQADNSVTQQKDSTAAFGGFESKVKFGEHLVTICACHDCHSPKKMTAHGPDIDSALLLSGHPASLPAPDANRNYAECKGYVTTSYLTSWVGPWGISYTAYLTSDESGIGNWSEAQFMFAIRNGKLKGQSTSRDILPPMPWQMYRNMSDNELSAIYAYLKTTKPISNVVPPPVPPMMAAAH